MIITFLHKLMKIRRGSETPQLRKDLLMRSSANHSAILSNVTVSILGLTLMGLVNCSSGDDSTNTITSSSSAALQGPMVFVNNTGDKTLTSVALKGDSGNAVVGTITAAKFENVALGDMQFSEGEWVFLNLGAANKVATIDPLTGAVPVHETNLPAGTRPVHLYRDPNDGEVIWVMNDGDNSGGTATPGDDLVNCAPAVPVPGQNYGGSVTVLHNSHLGPGGTPPIVLGTTCLLADGHKVAAFPSGAGVLKRAFISSTTAGEIAVLDNDETSGTYRQLIDRIDLCTDAGEALNGQGPCDVNANAPNTPNSPNMSNPHGIRFSQLTGKVYSIQENYRTIVEVDPTTLGISKTFDLAATPYTSFGMTPDGRFLLLRGDTTPASGTKLGVIDLGTVGNPRTDFTIPELNGTSPGSFKFSPDGKRFYILAGNAAGATKKDRLFAFDSSTLTAAVPTLTLLREIVLVATGGHSFDVLIQGAGAAAYLVVSNSTDNSISVINAADNLVKQSVPVGLTPGGVLVYYPGAAAAGNQATS